MESLDPSNGSKGMMHAGTFNNNAFPTSEGLVALEIFTPQKKAELNVLFEVGIYSQKYATHFADVREIDSFAGPITFYAEAAVINGVSEAASGKRENRDLRNAHFALPRMYFSS
ncbi:uncharacterized protein AB675_1037 [Cyphellophora attinorum]|uniref:Uncharacterized protein n=1 Tax=Cyphellophora attinorum TaxID=1664694 RepID=A0A0N0NKM6_9EURO|nr:uncharacterized protein AB675_1037 [Phialophora attinorum]KPI38208.1 hypothetical protein AB675_1037 [Phialophora attinorum]